MPWNDNSGGPKPGPWGAPPSGGGGPGGPKGPDGPNGGGPRPGGPRPPRRPNTPRDLNDLTRRFREQFGDMFGGDGRGPKPQTIAGLAGLAVVLWALSGVYIVQPSEQAVVLTFGASTGSTGPGLRYHLPWPFQTIEKVNVTELRKTDVGGREGAEIPQESLMLTGDENIVDLDFTIQWRVADAAAYVFNVRDPDEAVKAVAESAMREVVGNTALQPLMTTNRNQVQLQTEELMQRILDAYRTGIAIDQVLIRNAGPPPEVVEAFRDVQTAEQNRESLKNEARATGAQIVQEAIGYRAQVTQEALGEAARFNQVYDQYRAAPAVTRDRLYLETMERVLAKSNKVIIDSKGASAPIILPPDVFRPRTPAPAAAPATVGPAPTDSRSPASGR